MRSSRPQDPIGKLWLALFSPVSPILAKVISSPTAEMMPTVLTACSFVSRVANIAQPPTLTASTTTAARFAYGLLRRIACLSYSDVERVGGADANGRLVRRASNGHQ